MSGTVQRYGGAQVLTGREPFLACRREQLSDRLQVEVGRDVLAVGRVDEDGQVRGIDFGGRKFEDDLLTVWGEETELRRFTVRRAFKRNWNYFFFILKDFNCHGICGSVLPVTNVQIDEKCSRLAIEILHSVLRTVVD